MLSTVGDALILVSTVLPTVLVNLKQVIISESSFPFHNSVRYKATYSKTRHKLATSENDLDDFSLAAH